jgi:hypothetical protein
MLTQVVIELRPQLIILDIFFKMADFEHNERYVGALFSGTF